MSETKAIGLGHRQLAMLRKIVATNGGGIWAGGPDERVIKSLYRRGLVQGKSGSQWCAVHTRASLELIRKLDAKP